MGFLLGGGEERRKREERERQKEPYSTGRGNGEDGRETLRERKTERERVGERRRFVRRGEGRGPAESEIRGCESD